VDELDLSDGPLAYQLDQLFGLRMRPVHERFHQDHAVPRRGCEHPLRLGGIQRNRLFTKDVLAGFARLDGPFAMSGVGGGYVDGIDSSIGKELVVTVVTAGTCELRDIVRIGDRLATAASRPADECWSAAANRRAMLPVPRTPQFNALLEFTRVIDRGPRGRVYITCVTAYIIATASPSVSTHEGKNRQNWLG
jgi:hypothetical protein